MILAGNDLQQSRHASQEALGESITAVFFEELHLAGVDEVLVCLNVAASVINDFDDGAFYIGNCCVARCSDGRSVKWTRSDNRCEIAVVLFRSRDDVVVMSGSVAGLKKRSNRRIRRHDGDGIV